MREGAEEREGEAGREGPAEGEGRERARRGREGGSTGCAEARRSCDDEAGGDASKRAPWLGE